MTSSCIPRSLSLPLPALQFPSYSFHHSTIYCCRQFIASFSMTRASIDSSQHVYQYTLQATPTRWDSERSHSCRRSRRREEGGCRMRGRCDQLERDVMDAWRVSWLEMIVSGWSKGLERMEQVSRRSRPRLNSDWKLCCPANTDRTLRRDERVLVTQPTSQWRHCGTSCVISTVWLLHMTLFNSQSSLCFTHSAQLHLHQSQGRPAGRSLC